LLELDTGIFWHTQNLNLLKTEPGVFEMGNFFKTL
jgi:hypothetical protein